MQREFDAIPTTTEENFDDLPSNRKDKIDEYVKDLETKVSDISTNLTGISNSIADIGPKDNELKGIVDALITQVSAALDKQAKNLIATVDAQAKYNREETRGFVGVAYSELLNMTDSKIAEWMAKTEKTLNEKVDKELESMRNAITRLVEGNEEGKKHLIKRIQDNNKQLFGVINDTMKSVSMAQREVSAALREEVTKMISGVVAVRMEEIVAKASTLATSEDVDRYGRDLLAKNDARSRELRDELDALQKELESAREDEEKRTAKMVQLATAAAVKVMKKDFEELEARNTDLENRIKTAVGYLKEEAGKNVLRRASLAKAAENIINILFARRR